MTKERLEALEASYESMLDCQHTDFYGSCDDLVGTLGVHYVRIYCLDCDELISAERCIHD